MSSRSKKARKLAISLPRDEKGKFLPRGSVNLFKKKIKRHNNNKNTKKRKRKSETSHGSHNTAGSVLDLLNPVKDIIDLLKPLLGGSHTAKHKKQQAAFKKLITTGVPTKISNRTTSVMAKRRRNNNGNGKRVDVFPNFMTGRISQTVVNEFVTTLVNTPIPRIQTTRSGQRATVMELLWIEVMFPTIDMKAAPDVNYTFQMVIGTTPAIIIPFNNPRVFMSKRIDTHIITQGGGFTEQPYRYDMESKDGHGYLLAAETFHTSFFTVLSDQLNDAEWRMFYRFIDIPLSEFIGLVQSTQQ